MKKSKYPQIFCLSIFLLLFGFSIFTATAEEDQTGLHRPDAAAAGLPAGDLEALINGIVKWILILAGAACTVALVYAGFRYAFAGGNEEKTEQAKKILKYAIIGVIIIVGAYAMIQLITELIKGNVPPAPDLTTQNQNVCDGQPFDTCNAERASAGCQCRLAANAGISVCANIGGMPVCRSGPLN
ncbi:MAG: pilin [Candidatus Doudnabacteria bacterium]